MAKKAVATGAALTLAMIVSATQSEQGFLFASKDAAAPFVKDEMAEINDQMPNPENDKEFAVRATGKGINAMNTSTDANTSPTPTPVAKQTFERIMVKADAIPAKKRGGGGVNIYPFDDLAAPDADGNRDSFFVPATATKPKPWESLQSAVSAATRRYATQTGERTFKKADGSEGKRAVYEYGRKFEIAEYYNGGVKGALVSRSQ